MANEIKRFERPLGNLSYKKLFIISTEGTNTEEQYFKQFNYYSIVQVESLHGKDGSSPAHVLKRIRKALKKFTFCDTDEAWVVVDKDSWTDEQLHELCKWAAEKRNYGFALSNPKFEYWLLLHFEDGSGSVSLEKYIPNYDKSVSSKVFTEDRIKLAIHHAETKDNPPCADWPHTRGITVYRLVKNLLKAKEDAMKQFSSGSLS